MKSKTWLVFPTAILVGLIIFYGYQVAVYQNHFFNNTTIGNVDVGRLTENEAKRELATHLKTQEFKIIDNNQIVENIPKSDLGISYDIDKTVTHQMNQQNPWLWFMNYLSSSNTVYAIESTDLNQKALDEKMVGVKEKIEELNKSKTPTKNASIEVKDGNFSIVEEVQGDDIDVDKAVAAIKQDIEKGKSSIDLETFIKKPTLTSTDKGLDDSLAKVKELSEKNISYSINGEKIVVPKDIVSSWVTYTNDKVDFNQDAIQNYVTELGNKYNTSKNPSKFKSTKRGEVTVPAGAYSWTINASAEAKALKKLLLADKDIVDRVPLFQGSASPASPLIGNTYIEVDLENQHMWLYQDGKVVLDTAVITGKPSTPTPAGVFYVWNKERNAILRGEDYASPVDYWMPIDWTGVGIHDSPWQNAGAYGGDSFKTVGSHGCINTPPGVMKQLFETVGTGIPVIVF
ncbi:L,D-transpeptidase family protein [Vagococcus vulneris]|uniref:L,D-TPase catalytic domain-containing protein n=1 Tax=Vagococcus vulneris TaxID=1977869 RepID=A0A429ZT01_9ENTE|nr:L,D-transpeptidase family protein [Vagococcus vulneris]RST96750.1 hypothetical protein CBF37_10640 [Vagococcus vulneris]